MNVRGLCFLLLLAAVGLQASGQPLLPEVSISAVNGKIYLAWTCPYSSVKAVHIFRSGDSTGNFREAGSSSTEKGIQTFTDEAPLAGNNCYVVELMFNTGLKWRSNKACVVLPKIIRESDMVLQGKPARMEPATRTPEITTAREGTMNDLPHTALHFKLTNRDTTEQPYRDILSGIVSVDAATGHIRIVLPGDLALHHYSLKFYRDIPIEFHRGEARHAAVEIPRLNTSPILLDKRNFPRTGWYEFILRKDGVVLEGGYVEIQNEAQR